MLDCYGGGGEGEGVVGSLVPAVLGNCLFSKGVKLELKEGNDIT